MSRDSLKFLRVLSSALLLSTSGPSAAAVSISPSVFLGRAGDANKGIQILLIGRNDILNLVNITNKPLPFVALPKATYATGLEDEFPPSVPQLVFSMLTMGVPPRKSGLVKLTRGA